MRKIIFLAFCLFFFLQESFSQVILFHEDFEAPGGDDSVVSTTLIPTVNDWGLNTRLYCGAYSQVCDSCQVKPSSITYLTTENFSTHGYPQVILYFDQICKVDFMDMATIQVSIDGGLTWTQLTGQQYLGTGQFQANGNHFAANSYGNLWQPASPAALPLNPWWRLETFDISNLANESANVKVRFKLQDGGSVGPNNNKGWYLDNIRVEGTGYGLSGIVSYASPVSQAMAGVTVLLTISGSTYNSAITNNSGTYGFTTVNPGTNILFVNCNKPWGGVNSSDALLVLKHFVGMIQLSGLALQAADVNGDQVVNAADALMILQRFTGMINSFPSGDWVFESPMFTAPLTQVANIPIQGLCYGDVNGSYLTPP
ncbi:MAG: dockerin type I domain-containing protein [Bacteroidetes bacterium]|nr:dockerin type I domain-containing protein [Bacteroidota bacterium]